MPSEGFLPSDGILLQMIGCRDKSIGIFRQFVGFLPSAMKTERARYHGLPLKWAYCVSVWYRAFKRNIRTRA